MRLKTSLPLLALLAATTVSASNHEAATERELPSFSASETVTVTASVVAIDHETRDVTLRDPDGNEFSFVANEEVRNLDQVEAGDIVTAEVFSEVDITVLPGDGKGPAAAEELVAARAEKGAMPGGVIADRRQIIATVEAIDLEAETYTLKGPKGNVRTFQAMNPENLKLGQVGDLVVITQTTAVGIFVERPGEE